jgi:hypothetical protein
VLDERIFSKKSASCHRIRFDWFAFTLAGSGHHTAAKGPTINRAVTGSMKIRGGNFTCEFPANSFTLLRVKAG